MNNKSLFALILVFVLIISGCAQVTSEPDSSSGGKATAMPALKSGVQKIGGVVLGGGDQTPEGLMDAPRTFLYQVRLDSGEEINVTYTSYPPTPAGEKSAITLTFFEGVINPGNYLIANGTYDSKSKTLTIAKEGDSIETFAKKP
jgi:uncharacterized protein YceK